MDKTKKKRPGGLKLRLEQASKLKQIKAGHKAIDEMWKRYEFIVNTSKDFLSLIDADYNYIAVNNAYCKAHNKKQKEIVDRSVSSIWGEKVFNGIIRRHLDKCFAGEEVNYHSEFEFAAIGVRIMDVTYYPYRNNKGTVTHAVVVSRDITERRRAEEQIRQQLQRLTTLRQVDMAILSSLDLKVILNVLLNHLMEHLNIDAAAIMLLNPHTLTLKYAEGRGFHSHAIRHARMRLGEGLAGRVALERCPICIPSLQEKRDISINPSFVKEEDLTFYYGLPLIAKGQVKGTLEIFNRTRINPEAEWLDFTEALAGQAAIAIDNATMFNDLQRSNIELSLAYDTTIEGWSRALDL
ncbi:MAG: PAS domain-containing protein, partial [Nitrospirota bacterium]